MLFRAALLRCANCGQGRLFRHWFAMVPTCPRCGYRFAREEGFALGASVVNLVVCQIVAIGYLIVSIAITLPDPPAGKLAIGGLVVAIGSGLIFFPFSKTIWAAVDLTMHDTMGPSFDGGNVQPGVKPELPVGPQTDGGPTPNGGSAPDRG